jgi:hypothetical protein
MRALRFRTVVRDPGLTFQQVWASPRPTRRGRPRSPYLGIESALYQKFAARRDDLEDGSNAAYANGCVCRDCLEHQQRRIGRR